MELARMPTTSGASPIRTRRYRTPMAARRATTWACRRPNTIWKTLIENSVAPAHPISGTPVVFTAARRWAHAPAVKKYRPSAHHIKRSGANTGPGPPSSHPYLGASIISKWEQPTKSISLNRQYVHLTKHHSAILTRHVSSNLPPQQKKKPRHNFILYFIGNVFPTFQFDSLYLSFLICYILHACMHAVVSSSLPTSKINCLNTATLRFLGGVF